MYKPMTNSLIIMRKSDSGVLKTCLVVDCPITAKTPTPTLVPTWSRKIYNTKLYLIYITLVYIFLLDIAFVQRFVGSEFTLCLYIVEI